MATQNYIIKFDTKGTKRVEQNIKRIGSAASSVRKTLALMRGALVVVAAFRVFGRLASGLAEFSRAMAEVRAVTRSTADEMKLLRARARELGATTRFTASEVASGMVELGRAGFDTNEVLASIAHSLDLAQVGMISLSKATTIVAGTLRGFELGADQTQRVVDILTETSLNSLNTISDLGEAMKLVGPIAHGLGISVEELAASMGILGENNVRASIAGTSVRRILTDLAAPTGGLAKILDALNIAFEKVDPSVVGFKQALRNLAEAGVGTSLAAVAFGKRGANAFAILARAVQTFDEKGSDALSNFEKSLLGIGGATRETAKIMDDNLEGAFKRLVSAASELRIAFGDAGAESTLRDLVESLAVGLRFLAKNIDDFIQGLTILAAGGLLRAVAAGIAAVMNAVIGLTIAIATNPIGAMAAALSLLTVALFVGSAALITFGGDLEVIEGKTTQVRDVFDTLADTLGDTLVTLLNDAGFEFKDFGEVATAALKATVEGLLDFARILAGILNVAPKFFTKLQLGFTNIQFFVVKATNALREFSNEKFGTNFVLKNIDAIGKRSVRLQAELDGVKKSFSELFEEGKTQFDKDLDATAQQRRLGDASGANRIAGQFTPPPGPDIKPPTGTTLAELDALVEAKERQEDFIKDLAKLRAAISPATTFVNTYTEAYNLLKKALAQEIITQDEMIEGLKRVTREALGFGMNAGQLEETIANLESAMLSGAISMDEFAQASGRARLAVLDARTDAAAGFQRFWIRQKMEAEDAASQIETVLGNAFEGAQDALHEFITTGKADFSSLVDSIISDLARMALKMATSSIFESLTSGIGAPGGITGQSNGIQSLFDSIGSGNFLSTLGGLFNGAHGGSFNVNANNSVGTLPGVDNRLIALRARDGEEVHVTKKSEAGGGAATQQIFNFNVTSDNADSFIRSESQIQNKLMFGAQQAARRR